jgi:endonuclease/exonuclease/phosphatase family metal-dependent hydrolase
VKNNKKSIARILLANVFFLLNVIVILWLGLCAVAAVTDPARFRYLALFSLTIPFAILANIFFIIFWLFSSGKWRSLLSFLAIVICYTVTSTVFGLNFFSKNDMAKAKNRIKLMSWNAHGMGIFNTPHDKAFDKELLRFIKQQDADVLCLMEYPTPRIKKTKPFTDKIMEQNGYKYFRFRDDNKISQIIFLGTAIFSKYPLKNYSAHRLSEYIYLLQTDVELPGLTMRMFFVHLNTFGLTDKDKEHIEKIKEENAALDLENELYRSRSFMWRFDNAFVRRAKEVNLAMKYIKESPHPVMICGDLNDLPGSYTYTKMRGNLKDAFLSKGTGFGRTYNYIFSTLRIDHIFYDPAALEIKGFECPRTALSDHNPLIANFEISANTRH